MVTTWFSRANIAACAGGIVFFTLYLPYPFVKLWTHRFNIHAKGAVSLISNVAFGLGEFISGEIFRASSHVAIEKITN